MAVVPPTDADAPEPAPSPSGAMISTCPWCPYTADIRKRVLTHMESAHPQRWRDLALSPPIAEGKPY